MKTVQKTLLLGSEEYETTLNSLHQWGWKIVTGSITSLRIEYSTMSGVTIATRISCTLEREEEA